MINILERGIPWQIDGGPVDYSLVRNSIVHESNRRMVLPFGNLVPICQDFCRDTRFIFRHVHYSNRLQWNWQVENKIPI